MNNVRYQVVVEVDHKRARRAFLNGLKDLDALWPAIEAYCKPIDDEIERKHAQACAAYEAEKADYDAREKADTEKMTAHWKAWHEWKKDTSWRKGPEPVEPTRVTRSMLPSLYKVFGARGNPVLPGFLRERGELKRLAALASVANAPYKMEEEYALQMAAWESGERIAQIKQRIGAP